MRTTIAVLATAALALGGVSTVTAPSEAAGRVVERRLVTAIEKLPVAQETRRGYARAKFRHWVDADSDCRDTRDEVLAAESLVRVSGCDIRRGKWRSAYDGVVTKTSGSFDVDHLVPLAEAWDSGAKRWNAATRQRFANDLRDSRSLIAVTASSNRSKSDRDPAQWLPSRGRCAYLRQWVAVKTRWKLRVDRIEKRALRRQASQCKNTVIRVRSAVVRLSTSSGGGGGAGGGAGGGGGKDPRFDYCYEAKAAGYGPYHRGKDPEYAWYTDRDGDGVVCE